MVLALALPVPNLELDQGSKRSAATGEGSSDPTIRTVPSGRSAAAWPSRATLIEPTAEKVSDQFDNRRATAYWRASAVRSARS